jgi:AcrR family transcriptional regulator
VKKLSLRQRQGIETKLKITRIATDLFKKKGFNDVTIRDICEASSISVGTFYHHFISKDEIVNTGHYQIDLLWEERISNHIESDTKEYILYMFEEAGSQLHELGWDLASQSYQQLIAAKTKYTLRKDRPIYQKVHQAITQGLSEGVFLQGTDPAELTETLIRCSRGVVFDWCLWEGGYDLRKQMRHDILLFLSNYCR